MLKFLFPLFLFATSTFAQEYDLRSMPSNFSFVSIEEDGRLALRFIGKEGEEYIFEQVLNYYDGRVETATIRVNNASQTTRAVFGDSQSTFNPHDCAPSLGTCFYTLTDSEGVSDVKTESRMVGDIRLKDEYIRDGEGWLFWNRECTLYDEYGFWVDYVRTYWNGDTEQGYREQFAPSRIEELWRICDPAAVVS